MEQEKQEAPVQQKKKRLSTPLLIFIILMAVTAVLCAVVAGSWLPLSFSHLAMPTRGKNG